MISTHSPVRAASLLDAPPIVYLTAEQIHSLPTRAKVIERAMQAQQQGNMRDYVNLLNYLINGEGQSLPRH